MRNALGAPPLHPFNGARTFLSAAPCLCMLSSESRRGLGSGVAADRNVRAPLGRTLGFLLFVISACFSIMAQETVTIPKSRLEELQRKEAELDSLKGDLK